MLVKYVNVVKCKMTHEKENEPIWAVIANIVSERKFGPEGKEIKYGTKVFRPKTKVYIIGWHPGMCESIIVIGLARNPRKFVTITIRADWVENLRVKLVYNPAVISRIHEFQEINKTYLTEEFANEMCKTIPVWQTELRK